MACNIDIGRVTVLAGAVINRFTIEPNGNQPGLETAFDSILENRWNYANFLPGRRLQSTQPAGEPKPLCSVALHGIL